MQYVNNCSTVHKKGAVKKTKKFTCDAHAIHEDTVIRVRRTFPYDKVFYDMANLYKAFADQTRIKILWALSSEKMCVCDLAVLLGMTKSAISHQLRSLRLAKLVKNDRQGKVVYYSFADMYVREIFLKGFEHI